MPTINVTQRHLSKLNFLSDVAKVLIPPLELSQVLNAVMDRIARVLKPAEFGLIWLWDSAEGVLRLQAACGSELLNRPALSQVALQASETIIGKAYTEDTIVVLKTVSETAEALADLRPTNRSMLIQALGADRLPHYLAILPLRTEEHKFGVLVLGAWRNSIRFFHGDVNFIQTLADLIALAIDRARLEAEAQANREAKQADQLRAETLATLSHELRTPLGAIKGYCTALLLEEVSWPEEKQREFLHLIDEECDAMQTMISTVLDSSLIDVGQLVLEYQPVRMERLAREAVDEMRPRAGNHNIVLDFPAEFPIIDADPLRVKQVLRNIIHNAVKYSPDGGLVVIRGEVRLTDVTVSIADQGVGISPENLIPLFEKYFRVKSPAGYHIPGTGLGLPVARAIVEAHGGRIWAMSQVGKGTTLYFSLPRQGLSAELAEEDD